MTMTGNKALKLTIGAGTINLALLNHSEITPGITLLVGQFRKVCRIADSFMKVAPQGTDEKVQIDKESNPLQVKLTHGGGQPHLDIRRIFSLRKSGQTEWICTKDGVTLSKLHVDELLMKCYDWINEAEQKGHEAAVAEADGMGKATKTLKNAIKTCVATESRKRCHGCSINHPSLDQHDMCVVPAEEQVRMFGQGVLMNMDLNAICKKQKLDGTKTAFLHKAYINMFASSDTELMDMVTASQ